MRYTWPGTGMPWRKGPKGLGETDRRATDGGSSATYGSLIPTRKGALNGMLGRAWREYLLPLFSYGAYPFVTFMKHDESIPDEDVTPEYLVDNLWIVGSPETVSRKLRELFETVGGFGTLLWLTFDHSERRAEYEKSMRLLSEEVMPSLADLTVE